MRDWVPTPKEPKIYIYTRPIYEQRVWEDGGGHGYIKVGYTSQDDVLVRIKQQIDTASADEPDIILLHTMPAINGGRLITDKNIHSVLENQMGRRRVRARREWFEATVEDVIAAFDSLASGRPPQGNRKNSFSMRPEQHAAVEQTVAYFLQHSERKGDLHFLWNAKMRFGKTFTTYQLAKRMNWHKVLVLTYKPSVEDAWREDLISHENFRDWSFIGNNDLYAAAQLPDKIVWMTSFQAIFSQGDKTSHRLQKIFDTHWDAVILDEYHFGAWRDNAKELFADVPEEVAGLELQEEFLQKIALINTDHYLHLSGTPFRALAAGEFQEDQIFNWTYTDEQKAKFGWVGDSNPYLSLPQMFMMTYRLPEGVIQDADEDDLNLDRFFQTETRQSTDEGTPCYRFKNEDQVSLWLDFISGVGLSRDELLEERQNRSPMPYKDKNFRDYIRHTLWYLPSVGACHAMAAMIKDHHVLRHYTPVVAAGVAAGTGKDALPPVREAIKANNQTITLSCGKLTTGTTVSEWTAVFMLRSLKSPESYFQAAFRAQSPWIVRSPYDFETFEIRKDKCYIFDFDPRRALTLASEYCYQLDEVAAKTNSSKPSLTERMAEFLHYMPVLCHDNGIMLELDPGEAIDLATSGTGAAMLARRFQSPRMVQLNGITIRKLLEDSDLVGNLQKIESFRNLSSDLDLIERTLERHTDQKPKVMADAQEDEIEEKTDKEKNADEKAARQAMKQIRENLLKFITRLPVFMYLNDEREKTALEVIHTTDDALFEKATGITKLDFSKLLDLGVFNGAFMNETIRAFKQVEDNALVYLGDRVISGTYVAAWDTHVERGA